MHRIPATLLAALTCALCFAGLGVVALEVAASEDASAPLPPPQRRILRHGRPVPGYPAKPIVGERRRAARVLPVGVDARGDRRGATHPLPPQRPATSQPDVAEEAHAPTEEPRDRLPPPAQRVDSPKPVKPEPSQAKQAEPVEAPLPMQQALRLLTSTDFHARMRASRSLVAYGAQSLDPLGRIGQASIAGPGGLPVSATRGVLAAVAESLDEDSLLAVLRSPHRSVRRTVAAELGRRKSTTALPDLVGCLDDSCPCVRAAAVAALRKTTSRWFGYDAEAHPAQRARSRAHWIAYLRGEIPAGAPRAPRGQLR